MISAEEDSSDDFLLEDFLNNESVDFEDLFNDVFDEFSPNDVSSTRNSVPTYTRNCKSLSMKRIEPKTEPSTALPSLEKSDVRSNYPKLVENLINSQELKQIQKALRSICTEEFKFIFYYPKGNPHGVSYRELNGISTTADYLEKSFSSAPDSLFLIHSSQYIPKEDGSMTILCKFTSTGSKLYNVNAVTNGVQVTDAPSVKRLYASIDKVTRDQPVLEQGSEQYEELETIKLDTVRPQISLKQEINKFDRYKKQKVDTLGSFVQYASFSETSLQNKRHTSDEINPRTCVTNATGSYSSDDIMIAGPGTTFSHTILPLPVSFDIYGMLKIHVNGNSKVTRIDSMTAHKHLKMPLV